MGRASLQSAAAKGRGNRCSAYSPVLCRGCGGSTSSVGTRIPSDSVRRRHASAGVWVSEPKATLRRVGALSL